MKTNFVTLGNYVEEIREKVGNKERMVYSVTNNRGFVPSLEIFDKQVFSADISAYKAVQHKDIAYNPSRINVGSVAICHDKNGGAVSPMYTIIRCKKELLPEYLLYYLKSERGLAEINHRAEGAVRFQFKFRDLQRIEIYLPHLAEQARIIDLLKETEYLQGLRSKAIIRMDELAPALFFQMFGDPEHTKYDVQKLTELIAPNRPITYGILKPGPDTPNGVPYIRVVDIKDGRLQKERLRKTTNKIASEYKRSTLTGGDVLITIRGTVGKTCLVPTELSGANITQDTARISCGNTIDAMYLIGFLGTAWAQGWMQYHVRGQAVQGLNIGDLRKLPVPIPPIPLQIEFAARAEETRYLQGKQSVSSRKIDLLFQSILSKAFEGRL